MIPRNSSNDLASRLLRFTRLMSSTGDAVDVAGISNTACGNEIEYMTDRKAFSKLLAAYEQGKLDWSTYTDPNIRGKHCTYAGAIAKDRESYVAYWPMHGPIDT